MKPFGNYLFLADFKRELLARHGVSFNHLYTITNMPIKRFLDCFGCTAGAGSSCGGAVVKS
jgi:hypothetical protein